MKKITSKDIYNENAINNKIEIKELYKDKYKTELNEYLKENKSNESNEEEKITYYKSLKYKIIEDDLPNGLVKIFYSSALSKRN